MSEFYEKVGKGVIAAPFVALFVYVALIYSYLAYGYIVSITWGWFIPNTLIQYTPTFWESTGLVFMAHILTNRGKVRKSDHLNKDIYSQKDFIIAQLVGILSPWFFLVSAWLLKNHFFIL